MGRVKEMFEPIDSKKRFSNDFPLTSCFKCKKEIYIFEEIHRKRYCSECILKKSYFLEKKDFLDNVQRLNSYMGKYPKAKEPPYFKGIWFRSKFEKDIFVSFDYLGFEIWYEPIRLPFARGKGKSILTDFYVPSLGLWIECRGHERKDDIEGFNENLIFEGLCRDDFSSIYSDFDVTIDVEKSRECDYHVTEGDIELAKEQYLQKIDSSILSEFMVIKSNEPRYHYDINDDCTTLYFYRDKNSYIPVLININDEWDIVSNLEYEKQKNSPVIIEAYYIYQSYRNVYLKYTNRNNKIRVEKFVLREVDEAIRGR